MSGREAAVGSALALTLGSDAVPGPGSLAHYATETEPREHLVLGPAGGGHPLECVVVADSGAVERAGTHLLVVCFAVPEDGIAVLDDWYDTEHAPLLLEAPDWLRVRRLRVPDPVAGTPNCFVLHDLAGLDVLDGPERARAAAAPKRAVAAAQPWYATSRRWMFRPAG